MKAVHFGAGNIGRGFLGQLYFETGYHTTFVDVTDELIKQLNTRREYPLRIVGDNAQTILIQNISALNAAKQANEISEAVADADIASTAVGVGILGKIAPAIAAGIRKRFSMPDKKPLNFIVCENMIAAGPFLREQVRQNLPAEMHARLETDIGFVEASIGRMVPVMSAEMKQEDPLLVCVEAYCELPVDKEGFRGEVPPLKNMIPKPKFGAYVERKLFVHNAGHAVTAYLGYLRGHEYIWQAIADPLVESQVQAALAESRAGLVAKHGLDADELKAHADDIVHRFHNKELGDQVERVARDPLRKLGAKDRLVGAALLCLEHGIVPENLAFAVAAAIEYDHRDDPSARLLQELKEAQGLSGVLSRVCQLPPDSPLAPLIEQGVTRLRTQGWIK